MRKIRAYAVLTKDNYLLSLWSGMFPIFKSKHKAQKAYNGIEPFKIKRCVIELPEIKKNLRR